MTLYKPGGKPNPMSGEINKPISNCRYPLIVKQLFFSFILLLLCGIARSQTIPNFTINKKSGCVPLTAVSFTETSTGDVVIRRDWDLGNGTVISNGTAVVSTDYLTAQKFYISLTVTFANGNVKTKTDSVMVHDTPAISITGDSVVCLTATKKLDYKTTVTSTDAIAGYKWMVDADSVANTANLYYNYRVPGTHTLTFFVRTASGCVYSATKIIVIDYIAAYFALASGRLCGSGTVTFLNGSVNFYPFPVYIWSYGDGSSFTGQEESHNYTMPGNYTVKLISISTTGCRDSATFVDTVKVLNVPKAVINGQDLFCVTPANTLQYSGTITSVDVIRQYKWAIDGSTVANTPKLNYRFTKPGSHLLTFTIKTSRGCDAAVSKIILIDSVKTNFTVNAAAFCGDGSVSFTNLTQQYAAISNYLWSFGDGASSAATDIIHNYTAPGKFTVKLFAQTINGCKDSTTFTDSIKLYTPPSATISGKDIICLTPSTNLQYASNITSTDAIAKYKWMIDTDSVASTANLAINYRKPGKHTIRLDIATVYGCTFSVSKQIIIDSVKTKFSISAARFCGSGDAVLTNLSTQYGAVNNFEWSLGDGTFINGNNTSHTYLNPGKFTIKLLGITENGCRDSTVYIDTIKVFTQPSATISGKDIVCLTASTSLQYTGNITSADVIAKYKWMIDSDSVSNKNNLAVNYHVPGKHVILYEIKTVNGCIAAATKNILIDSIKTNFSIGAYTSCGGGTIQFANLSANAYPVNNYTWDFGDNSFYTGSNVSHTYTSQGNYTVKLSGNTENGCKDSTIFTDTIKIFIQPTVKIEGDSIHCKPGLYQYSSISTAVESIELYQWYVDNKPAGNNSNLLHYFTAGNHIVSLKVSTLNGCSDTASKNIIIDSVKTNFSISQNKFCNDTASVQFTNNVAARFAIVKYEWLFGDNTISSLPNPLHTYQQAGMYDVTLIVTTEHGCTDTLLLPKAIEVNEKPIASFTGAALHCSPGRYIYNASVNNSNWQYLWKVNGIDTATVPVLNYNFSNTGVYDISLTVITGKVCTAGTSMKVIIDFVAASFNQDNSKICTDTGTVWFSNLTVSHAASTSYVWDFGDGNTSGTFSPAHFYANAGTFIPSLKATTVNGCSSNAISADTVRVYAITAGIAGEDEKCMQQKLVYRTNAVTKDNIISYNWKLNNNDIGNAESVQYDFVNAGTYNLQLSLRTATGCTATADKIISIHPLPSASVSADTVICKGSTIRLRSYGGTVYQWEPAVSLQNSNTAMPDANPISSTDYIVIVGNQYGCTQNDTVKVTVDLPTGLTVSKDEKICAGNKIQLKATANAASYQWTPAAGLSNVTDATPFASPIVTTDYRVIAYSNNVCKNDTGHIIIGVGNVPVINAGKNQEVTIGKPVQLFAKSTAADIATYLWSPTVGFSCSNCPNPQFIAGVSANYTVTVTTIFGCTASDEISITATASRGDLYMPNAFSPNNDGLNDRFYVRGNNIITVKNFVIFNRYGQKVFEKQNVPANDPAQGWDGYIKGEPADAAGSYIYILGVIDKDGKEITLKGSIIIVR